MIQPSYLDCFYSSFRRYIYIDAPSLLGSWTDWSASSRDAKKAWCHLGRRSLDDAISKLVSLTRNKLVESRWKNSAKTLSSSSFPVFQRHFRPISGRLWRLCAAASAMLSYILENYNKWDPQRVSKGFVTLSFMIKCVETTEKTRKNQFRFILSPCLIHLSLSHKNFNHGYFGTSANSTSLY